MTSDNLRRKIVAWLSHRADNVAVGLLTAMFLSFLVQIASRYVFNRPVSWTLEVCLTTWIWVVFWCGAFLIKDRQHVKFDVLYVSVRPGVQRIFALIAAVAIVVGMAASLPASISYVTFMKIETSATLGIRLDYVFSVYIVFVVAVIVRYLWRAYLLVRGGDADAEERPGAAAP